MVILKSKNSILTKSSLSSRLKLAAAGGDLSSEMTSKRSRLLFIALAVRAMVSGVEVICSGSDDSTTSIGLNPLNESNDVMLAVSHWFSYPWAVSSS